MRLKARSAELCVVFTYLHWEALEALTISDTHFATKTQNQEVSLFIYFNTAVLSVQNTEFRRSSLSSLLPSSHMNCCYHFRIPCSGIMTGFKGATRDFPIMKELSIWDGHAELKHI